MRSPGMETTQVRRRTGQQRLRRLVSDDRVSSEEASYMVCGEREPARYLFPIPRSEGTKREPGKASATRSERYQGQSRSYRPGEQTSCLPFPRASSTEERPE